MMLTTLQRDGETSPCAVAEACSRRTDGVIDRSRCEILRGTQWSAQGRDPCLGLASRNPSWQRSYMAASTDRTYDRNRFDSHAALPLQAGGRPHMGPRFRGDERDGWGFNLAGTYSSASGHHQRKELPHECACPPQAPALGRTQNPPRREPAVQHDAQ